MTWTTCGTTVISCNFFPATPAWEPKTGKIWQGRLMVMEGVERPQLVKLHGMLIAFTWVEQNTGEIPCCYRITSAGLRAMRRVKADGDEEAIQCKALQK